MHSMHVAADSYVGHVTTATNTNCMHLWILTLLNMPIEIYFVHACQFVFALRPIGKIDFNAAVRMSILMHFSHSVWLDQTKRHLEKSRMRFYVSDFFISICSWFLFSPLSLSFIRFMHGFCLPNAMPHNNEYDMMANTNGDFGLVFVLFHSRWCQYAESV